MMKKLKKADFLFVTALLIGLLIHIYFVFSAPFFDDESFYATIPFRLAGGDSLIQHEWHLSQFSSLFSYLPVYIWTAVKGSADGIFIYLRCVYLVIHTAIAVVIYIFFRKHKNWAVITSIMFYAQASYRTLAISYQSMFVIFLLLLSFCLISIYKKPSLRLYIFAGVCFGCCCVCNPLFCFAFLIYLLVCALWPKREKVKDFIIGIKSSRATKKEKKTAKKQKEQPSPETFSDAENYNCFFTKKAVLQFLYGILAAVVIAVIFFFATGGTIGSIFENIGNLLGSSEYDIASDSVFSKFAETLSCLQKASLGTAWVLPVLFIVLLFDKKRQNNTHRFAYLFVSVLWSMVFLISTIIIYKDMYINAVSLPFCLISTVCYFLTEKKNKTLFYCLYIPGLIGTFFQYLAANTHLAVIGVVLAVNNVAGVFFAMDLWKELRSASKDSEKITAKKIFAGLCYGTIIIGVCIQFLIYGMYYQVDRIYTKDNIKVATGPYAGVYMTEEDYNQYIKEINDMNVIRTYSKKGDPVYLASYNNWMYMYLDRPMATYTTWYGGSIDQEQLTRYYKENPDKIPRYIYVESSDPNKARTQIADKMFNYTKKELSNGVLLIVKNCKF